MGGSDVGIIIEGSIITETVKVQANPSCVGRNVCGIWSIIILLFVRMHVYTYEENDIIPVKKKCKECVDF